MQRDLWEVGEVCFEAQLHDGYVLVIVTDADGHVWATTLGAATIPHRQGIEWLWKRERRSFQPFDQSTGCYV